MDWCSKLLRRMVRTKDLHSITAETTLSRCLGVLDLTLMGIGSMVGSGIYVMTGIAAKEQAGPAIIICFVLAGIIATLAAACYTELASRLHKTGSTYLYIYITLGELAAFLIGCSILICIILGGATNGRAWSAYLDSLFHGKIANFTETRIAQWTYGDPIAPYPDFMAASIILLLTVVVALGAQCSSKLNMVIVSLNICILLFVTVVGYIYADISNWTSPDTGGFLPYGITGLVGGSAACFWAFSGFEQITVAIEETKNPRRNLPIGMSLCIIIATLLYMGSSSALTLMTSYTKIDKEAPLPSAFKARGLTWAQYIVAIGPLCGLTSTLLNSIFAFGRMLFALSEDGLMFAFCGKVNGRTQVPVIGIIIGGVLQALVAIFLDLRQLIGFSVNFSLMQYILVAAVVIILRYKPMDRMDSISVRYQKNEPKAVSFETKGEKKMDHLNFEKREKNHLHFDSNGASEGALINKKVGDFIDSDEDDVFEADSQTDNGYKPHGRHKVSMPISLNNSDFTEMNDQPGTLKQGCSCLHRCCDFQPGRWAKLALFLVAVCMLLMLLTVSYGRETVFSTWWGITLLVVLGLAILLLTISFYAYHQNLNGIEVKLPCVPVLPLLSMFSSLTLIVFNSNVSNWIGTAILLAIALIFYFAFGIRNSKLNSVQFRPLTQMEDTVALLNQDGSDDEF